MLAVCPFLTIFYSLLPQGCNFKGLFGKKLIKKKYDNVPVLTLPTLYYASCKMSSKHCANIYSKILPKRHYSVNSLPNEEIFDWSKLKAFADDKINMNEKYKFGLGRVENIVGKGENAGYQHFLLFP